MLNKSQSRTYQALVSVLNLHNELKTGSIIVNLASLLSKKITTFAVVEIMFWLVFS